MIFMKKYLFLDIWILFKLALFKQFILVLYELREKNKHFTWNLAKYYQKSVWDEHFLDDCWWFFPYRSQDLLDFSWFWSTLSKDISELRQYFSMNLFLNHIYSAGSLQKTRFRVRDPSWKKRYLRYKNMKFRKSICTTPLYVYLDVWV